MDPSVVPTEMEVDRAKGLTIVWGDGRRSFYPTRILRQKCPCATCRDIRSVSDEEAQNPLRIIDPATIVPESLTITDAREVGNYALGFTFSDGHATGIYDFRFLRALDVESGG